MTTIYALCADRDEALRVVEALRAAGFGPEGLGVALKGHEGMPAGLAEDVDYAADGTLDTAARGVVGGGVLGGLAGLLVGFGILTVPGLGPILAAGPLAAVLGGGAMGATAGGLAGTLADRAFAPEEAVRYREALRGGAVLVSVDAPEGREAEARAAIAAAQGPG